MEETTTTGAIKSVLMVDDDQFLLDLYAQKFEANGMSIVKAASADEALEKLRGGLAPDLIVFDIVMPHIDGYGFLEKMNEEHLAPSAIRIALTNQTEEGDIDRAQKLGIEGYIAKASAIPSETVDTVLKIAKDVPPPHRS